MLSAVQEILSAACGARDPVTELQRRIAVAGDAVTPVEREQLLALDEDGLRLTARIVRELRLERVLRGSRDAADAFDNQPGVFSREFMAWCDRDPRGHVFPEDEGAAWDRR